MKVVNREFHRNYQTLEEYEAGIALSGGEVKSVKAGHIRLEDAFVRLMGNEAYLVNAEIPIYIFARPTGYDQRQRRKLLLHKDELLRLQTKLKSASGLTIAPYSCYNKGRYIKLKIALVKGRRDLEKRKLEKGRDIEREGKREMKEYMKV